MATEAYSGIILGSFWDHSGMFWVHSGMVLESFWVMGSSWGHFGIVLASFWDRIGAIVGHGVVPEIVLIVLGSVWDHVGHGCRESVATEASEGMGVAKV